MQFRTGDGKLQPRSLAIILVGIAISLLILTAIGFYVFSAVLYYDSYDSSYEYEATIYVDQSMENVVIYLPVPVSDGDSNLEELELWSYENTVDEWDWTISETAYGQMLRVEFDVIRGEDEIQLSASVNPGRTIETRDPRGVEPVLSPMEELTHRQCEFAPDHMTDLRCYTFHSVTSVDHGGPDEATLGIHVRHSGANEWWVFGWSGNRYQTTVANFEFTVDSTDGWIQLNGEHEEGRGSYGGILPPPPR